jgi:type II secretory pathway component PulK
MWSSTRSSCHARADGERGFALLAALALAVLFFGLITLVLWESTLRYRAAQSFRARVIAQTLAENGAELAAKGLADGSSLATSTETDEGTMAAMGHSSQATDGSVQFEIQAEGVTLGVRPAVATVTVKGYVDGGRVTITSSKHSQ